MTNEDLKKQFEKETETPAINSQGEPDINYVKWLEDRLLNLSRNIVEYLVKENIKARNRFRQAVK